MANENQIYIIAEVQETKEVVTLEGERDGRTDVGGGWGNQPKQSTITQIFQRKRVPLDAQALKSQMQGMLAVVNELFDQAQTTSGLQLNEVELSVEINAEGQVSLVGNGGKLGNTGGITLKFVRPQ